MRIVPGLANAAGANGTRFESTLYLTSFGADTTVDRVCIPEAGEVPPAPVTRSLKAGQTLRVDNAVASLFGLAGKAGTLRLRSAQPFGARAVTPVPLIELSTRREERRYMQAFRTEHGGFLKRFAELKARIDALTERLGLGTTLSDRLAQGL